MVRARYRMRIPEHPQRLPDGPKRPENWEIQEVRGIAAVHLRVRRWIQRPALPGTQVGALRRSLQVWNTSQTGFRYVLAERLSPGSRRSPPCCRFRSSIRACIA